MKLAILGYGAEGKSVEKYFKTHPYENIPPSNIEIKVFDDFTDGDIDNLGLENFDIIFRSPSVRPHYNFTEHDDSENPLETSYLKNKPYWTSATKYFFEHCPAEIISVTGTKGKGTTCSMITALLDSINQQIYNHAKDIASDSTTKRPRTFLVGNIGIPPLDVLDQITEHDNVVFEMSSFQLWDLHANSCVSVILRIEPDHLNIHKDFDEYVYAKAALARYKTKDDFLVYYRNNPITASIAKKSTAHKITYPLKLRSSNSVLLKKLLDSLTIPGAHNRENAEAALAAVAARYFAGDVDAMLESELYPALVSGLHNFKGLPHRCQFLRELNGVRYYDDNYCTALPALDVALKAFENSPIVLIAGGFSKGVDSQIKNRIFSTNNLAKAILIGDTAKVLAKDEDKNRYEIASSLEDAVSRARIAAEKLTNLSNKSSTTRTKLTTPIVLMSPGFASFDMFKNATDRGEQYTNLVKNLN